MEKRWLFSQFCFLSVPSITGQSLDVITETEVVRTLPCSDVTLVCILPKPRTTYIIQTQWSKTDDSHSTKIAVYHPIYGTHYFKFSEASYNFSVSFSTRKCCSQDVTESSCSTNPSTSECSQWALHLKNVTISLSGQYECSFATYPYGTKAAKIQLVVMTEDNRSNGASSEAFTTTVSEDLGNSTLTSAVMTASEPQSTSLASLDATSLANLAPASITQDLSHSSTKSPQSLRNATYSSENTTVAHHQTPAVTRGKDFFTASSLLNSTGDGRIIKASHFPWPTVVAFLLLFCGSLIAVGIRKWCQYQQEIMNRPPSFKPPPPPIKYTSVVESDGTPPSCHELENL